MASADSLRIAAEFGICAACFRGAVDFGAVKFRSLLQRVWLCNLRKGGSCYQYPFSTYRTEEGRPGGCTAEEATALRARGYVGVYKTVRVTDGAELLNGGGWRLPSGQIISPH